MKDIPGVDEDGNLRHGPFELYFKNGEVSCQGEFDNGKKSVNGSTSSTTARCSPRVATRTGGFRGRWKWFYKTGEPRATGGFDEQEQKHGAWKRYHPNGQLWMKVASNTERRKATGRLTTSRASW